LTNVFPPHPSPVKREEFIKMGALRKDKNLKRMISLESIVMGFRKMSAWRG